MKQLLNILNTVPEFARLAADLESGRSPVEVAGLSPVHRAHFAAGLLEGWTVPWYWCAPTRGSAPGCAPT